MSQTNGTETEDFVIPFTPEHRATLKADDGTGFRRVNFGDYRFRIVEVGKKSKEGANPHVMSKITFEAIEAYDESNEDCVGLRVTNLYAGSRESPGKMQRRLEALLQAVKIESGPTGFSSKQLLGRELDATIVWELSDGDIDPETGILKKWVNDRVKGERPVGTARPPMLNPRIDSRQAVAYLESQGYEVPDMGTENTTENAAPGSPPWQQTAGVAAPAAPVATPSFRPEADTDATVHQYRAHVKMNTPQGANARKALVEAGFDPDGPVNVDHLPEPFRGQFLSSMAQKGGGGSRLPPLGGGGEKRKTGTRTPRA
jgi:hypothetical protein